MNANDSHIIHNFGDRLAIDRAVKNLTKARNAYEQDKQAQELAAKGQPALKALLRNLNASDPTLRGGLGRLAKYLDPAIAIPALRLAAMDETRDDAARLTAVMILERYLDQEIDPAMAQRIPASYDVARESGEEAIAIAETDPMVLVEYAEQLLEEPPEIVHAVLQVIMDMETPQRAPLLMAIAAYGDASLQKIIVQALGGIRHTLAIHSLQTLWRLVTPELQPLVRRQIRKLQLAGVSNAPSGNLRALWSPVNALGYSFLWIIHVPENSSQGDLLILILHDQRGIVNAVAHPDLDLDDLPLPAPRGATHKLPMIDSPHRALAVEINPMLGLELLAEMLSIMEAEHYPWPGEIVVFGRWLWAGRPLGESEITWSRLPKPAANLDETAAQALLDHPAFAGWVWTLPELQRLLAANAKTALSKGGALHQQVIDILLNDENRALLSQRLWRQSQWLTLVKDRKPAAQTLAVRKAVEAGDSEHPFIKMLAWRSLLTAAADRAMLNALKSMEKEPKK